MHASPCIVLVLSQLTGKAMNKHVFSHKILLYTINKILFDYLLNITYKEVRQKYDFTHLIHSIFILCLNR